MVPVFKNVGQRSTAKNYHPVSLFSVVSKVFEKLVNNSIVDHLEKSCLFSDFHYVFRSSQSTADLLTVVSDRIARDFNRSGATQAVVLDIFKASDRVWHAGLLHKLRSYGISGQIFGLISSFLSNRRLWVVLDGKSSQECPVNTGIPEGSILGPTFFLPEPILESKGMHVIFQKKVKNRATKDQKTGKIFEVGQKYFEKEQVTACDNCMQ